jgi:hypothetical protein
VTLGEWLREREPSPPPRLAERIQTALGHRTSAAAADASALCLDAADVLLRDLLARGSAGRESALDLLAVDALVTYAFESAAADPTTFAARAHDAMHRLASTAQ